MKSNFSYLRILRTKPLLPWILKWLSCVIANEPQCHLIAAVKERNPGLIKWSCFWNYLFRTSGKAEIDQGWWKAMTKNNVSLLALHTSSIPNTNPPTLHSSPISICLDNPAFRLVLIITFFVKRRQHSATQTRSFPQRKTGPYKLNWQRRLFKTTARDWTQFYWEKRRERFQVLKWARGKVGECD